MTASARLDQLNSGDRLATAIVASSNARRAWLGIHPFKVSYLEEYENGVEQRPWRFKIRVFEVDRAFDFTAYDLHPEYIHIRHESSADSVDELMRVLADFGVRVDELCAPSECDYPL